MRMATHTSLLIAVFACTVVAWPGDATCQESTGPRRGVMPKSVANEMPVKLDQTRVVIKLAEGQPRLVQDGQIDAPDILGVLGSRATRSFFAGLETQLAHIRERQQAVARPATPPAVDLSLYFEVFAQNAEDVRQLVAQLNALPSVELAYPRERATPPPGDDPPFTPDFTGQQGYRAAAPNGVDAHAMLSTTGASGVGITVLDIEWGWHFGHEDIAGLTPASLIGPPISNPLYNNHGTAVSGILAADADGAGVTGMTPDITLRVATDYPSSGYSVANAIVAGMPALQSGDVMLLEAQANTPLGLGPTEWYQADFDAILVATNLGIITVEAAGNGGVNLDSPMLNGLFNIAVRDSGAIIVGASYTSPLTPASFSSYGSRVTANGWGSSVTTTGYGWLFSVAGMVTQDYTASFSGTSSASPMVTSAVVALRGAAEAQLDSAAAAALDAITIRTLIENTGTPIASIGSRPDAAALLTAANILRGLTVREEPQLGTTTYLDLDPAAANIPADIYGLFGGTTTANATLPAPFLANSRLLLDLNTAAPVTAGILSRVATSYATAVPNNVALIGQSFYFQAVFMDLTNNTLATSNSARIYLRH